MKQTLILMLLPAMALLTSCGKDGGKPEDDVRSAVETQEAVNAIHRLSELHMKDARRVGSNNYSWTIDRVSCDSLDIVEDDMGYRYVDNMVKILLHRNGAVVFSRTFTKADFAHLLDRDFYAHSILDGCRFMQVEDGMVVFSLTVSYPDSDMSQPFKLYVASDGSTRMVKDNDLGEEYQPDSLMND